MAGAPRRRKLIGRRRVDEEGDEAAPDAVDLIDDDSLTEGSIGSDDEDRADDTDTSDIDETSPIRADRQKNGVNGAAKAHQDANATRPGDHAARANLTGSATSDTTLMLNGVSKSDADNTAPEISFEEASNGPSTQSESVSTSAASQQPQKRESVYERQRREHDMYRQKRDEDPAFVPNRGAFFMHDHRGPGPAANGFRPFRGGRGRGRGGGIGGPYAPVQHFHQQPADPTTNTQWAHDMHETVVQPPHPRQPARDFRAPAHGPGVVLSAPPSATPINRTMSVERNLGIVNIRVSLPSSGSSRSFKGMIKQYTKLPDHRPPMRRDKAVRISLPEHNPRYIFPAVDRSFIFIPRAMRPNQRVRGKPHSGMGSMGGYSRRTSIFGGSFYGGSGYSPSVMSRRSSVAPGDMGHDYLISPANSTMSRPPLPLPVDNSRPVVRLPPSVRPDQYPAPPMVEPGVTGVPPPQTHPLPQKPPSFQASGQDQPHVVQPTVAHSHLMQENERVSLPMHQPRPQKTVSVETIETPGLGVNPVPAPSPAGPHAMAFHQQMPPQISNALAAQEAHHRNTSYPSHTTGTPLSQIPEKAIHAAPFQPSAYSQGYYQQPYQMMPPPPQNSYYYPPYGGGGGGNMPPNAAAPPFVPGAQQPAPVPYQQHASVNAPAPQGGDSQTGSGQNLIAQEVNGMVYYYDSNSLPPVPPSYPSYQGQPGYAPHMAGMNGMNGMVPPSPDGFYYPQQAPQGVMYYPQ